MLRQVVAKPVLSQSKESSLFLKNIQYMEEESMTPNCRIHHIKIASRAESMTSQRCSSYNLEVITYHLNLCHWTINIYIGYLGLGKEIIMYKSTNSLKKVIFG